MERNQHNKSKLDAKSKVTHLTKGKDAVYFLNQVLLINTILSESDSEKDLFNSAAEFFENNDFESTLLFQSTHELTLNYSLLFKSQNDHEILDLIDFSSLHKQVKKQDSVVYFRQGEEVFNGFVFALHFQIQVDENYILYVIGSKEDLTNSEYLKFFELVGSLIKNQLLRIKENQEVQKIKESLEKLVEKKSSDLDRVVETLSQQYSELKYQHDKRAELIKEIHHRVNNNLQVISSLLSLYISSSTEKERIALEGIRDRVQVMALIHLNVYKSVEMSLVDFKSYLRDLFSYLRSVNTKVKLFSTIDTSINTIKLDTLVPLGLLITEVIDFWLKKAHDNKLELLEVEVVIKKDLKTNVQKLIVKDKHGVELLNELNDLEEQEQISTILLAALTEQLDGEFKVGFSNTNELSFTFVD